MVLLEKTETLTKENAHGTVYRIGCSCTAGVLSANGKRLQSVVLETSGKALIEFLKLIQGEKHLIIEEGTHSNWLYEMLSPHVQEMVVIGVPKSKGQKNDKIDAFGLAHVFAKVFEAVFIARGDSSFRMERKSA